MAEAEEKQAECYLHRSRFYPQENSHLGGRRRSDVLTGRPADIAYTEDERKSMSDTLKFGIHIEV